MSAIAPRIRANLDRIEELAAEGADAFEETQLLVSLLGVLVMPQQRSDDALRAILDGYEPLPDAVRVLHAELEGHPVAPDDPAVRPELPRLLRNGLAHANILALRDRADFSGIRIWNEDEVRRVTFVADLAFPEVRRLARLVLDRLAEADPRLDDPVDPMSRLAGQGPAPRRRRRSGPKVPDTVWDRLVAACGGDVVRARAEMDGALDGRARAIRGKA